MVFVLGFVRNGGTEMNRTFNFLAIATAAIIAVCIWIFASWVEVIAKNTAPDPSYNKYNAIVLLTSQEVNR